MLDNKWVPHEPVRTQRMENSFQYLPLISVEFSSQNIGLLYNFNMIGGYLLENLNALL